jgi:hypothetical protein
VPLRDTPLDVMGDKRHTSDFYRQYADCDFCLIILAQRGW